jgi:hypothetical protein
MLWPGLQSAFSEKNFQGSNVVVEEEDKTIEFDGNIISPSN